MTNLLSFIAMLTYILSVDIALGGNELDTLLMERAVMHSGNDSTLIENYFGFTSGNKYDVCVWSGIQCIGNNVIAFALTRTEKLHPILNIEWLPPSLQKVHLWMIIIPSGFTVETLPRALRYLYLMECSLITRGYTPQSIDLNKLPQKLEEFHLYKGWFSGKIYISTLPVTMCILQLIHSSIRSVHIDARAFSHDIKYINLSNASSRAPKILWLDAPLDKLEVNHEADTNMEHSHYFQEFMLITMKIRIDAM